MEHDKKTNRSDDTLDLDALLHPARAFAHPMDVVRNIDLTLNEKRAILASWASDACAVEAAPELRINTAGKAVRWDDIMMRCGCLIRQTPLSLHAHTHRGECGGGVSAQAASRATVRRPDYEEGEGHVAAV